MQRRLRFRWAFTGLAILFLNAATIIPGADISELQARLKDLTAKKQALTAQLVADEAKFNGWMMAFDDALKRWHPGNPILNKLNPLDSGAPPELRQEQQGLIQLDNQIEALKTQLAQLDKDVKSILEQIAQARENEQKIRRQQLFPAKNTGRVAPKPTPNTTGVSALKEKP